jgi:hypothetical protein
MKSILNTKTQRHQVLRKKKGRALNIILSLCAFVPLCLNLLLVVSPEEQE